MRRDPTNLAFPGLLLAAFAAGHLAFLRAPFVNIEGWTGEAARLAYEGRLSEAIAAYRSAVSSPPFAFFAIVPAYAVFGVSEWAARLPTLLAALATLALVWAGGTRLYSARVGALAASLLALNPLFWTFAGVICCNDLPFALVSCALLFSVVRAVRDDSVRWHLISGGFLALALLTKFNAGVYPFAIGVVLIASSLRSGPGRSMRSLVRLGACYVPGLVCALAYYLVMHRVTGGLINRHVAPTDVGRFGEFALLAPPRLAYYLTWIGLFVGPMALLPLYELWKSFGARRIARALIWLLPLDAVLIGTMNWVIHNPDLDLGELRLGWVEHVLPIPVLVTFQMLGLLIGEGVLACFLVWAKRRPWPSGTIALWTLSVLFADSFWRGAQRYVVYLLPGLVLYLADLTLEYRRPARLRVPRLAAVASTLAIGLGLGLFSSAYFATEGYAAADVAAYVNRTGLSGLELDINNSVLCHCAYRVEERMFAPPGETPRWRMVTYGRHESTEGAVYVRDVRLLGVLWKRYGVAPYGPHSP